MLQSIYRLARRHALRRPLQSFFFVVGVAIGVAMIVAIDLANGSADRAFQLAVSGVNISLSAINKATIVTARTARSRCCLVRFIGRPRLPIES